MTSSGFAPEDEKNYSTLEKTFLVGTIEEETARPVLSAPDEEEVQLVVLKQSALLNANFSTASSRVVMFL